MNKALWIVGAFLANCLLSNAAWAACGFRSNFFRSAGEGEIAYIREAINEQTARRRYRGWCPVRDAETLPLPGHPMLFAINNRASVAGEPRFYVAKIYRYSRDTRRDPLFTFRRSGAWQNPHCPGRGARNDFYYVERGKVGVLEVFNRLRTFDPRRPGPCDAFRRWLGHAFGRGDLALADAVRFMAETPATVIRRGIDNWSIHFVASTYRTESSGNFGPDFPHLAVTPYGDEEILVHLAVQGPTGLRSSMFRVTP